MLNDGLKLKLVHQIVRICMLQALNDKSSSDAMLYLTVHLLDLAVSEPSPVSSHCVCLIRYIYTSNLVAFELSLKFYII